MTLRRVLAWGMPALVVLAAGLWWTGEKPESVRPVAQPPAVVMLPTAAAPAERATDIDALWKRYEALSQTAPMPASDAMVSPSTEASSAELALAEATRERQVTRERSKQRRAAVLAARNNALTQMQNLKPGDVNGLLDAIQGFNQQLKESGVEAQIDIEGIRKQLVGSQKLAEINQALLDEALKGTRSNPQRLQALSRELSQLQKEITGNFATRSSGEHESP